ncbi:MAG: VOC family protein [Stappiaceae bacterium]
MPGLDHIVLACRDLEAVASQFERAGFTLTPKALHSWGTANRLVQLDGAFLEILSIANQDLIQPATGSEFSFGDYNRQFLSEREGASMMVLHGKGMVDQNRFEEAGIGDFDLFSFERSAGQPDGSVHKVAFDLAFAASEKLPNISFFTCLNKFPENFWKSEYQVHANTARKLAGITIVADNPSDHHAFLSAYSGQRDMRATSFGITIETEDGAINVLTPEGFERAYGRAPLAAKSTLPAISAYDVIVEDIDKVKAILNKNNQTFRTVGRRIVPEVAMPGITVLAFLSG